MDAYRLAILVVFCLASHSLATHVHSRWLGRRGISYDAVYVSVMMLTASWGFTLFSPSRLFNLDPQVLAVSLLAGPFLGLAASISDRAIVRHCVRRRLMNLAAPVPRTGQRRHTRRGYRVASVTRVAVAGELARKRTLGLPADPLAMWQRNTEQHFKALPLVLLAAFEELLYRGFLIHVCLMLHTSLAILAVTGTVVAFALSHIVFGWPHVLAKFPLGLLTTISALTFSTVLAAIVAHVVFNLIMWDSWRKQSA
jgi:membrane protease YdiL (CAAX protease family)